MNKLKAALLGENLASNFIKISRIEITKFNSSIFFRSIIETKQASYFEYPMNEKVLGHTLKDGLGTSIMINTKLSGYRKNFTIAHEIGHLLLHVDDALPLDTKETTSLAYSQFKKEVEANTFAAHLMLPDKVLKYQIMSGLSITAVSNISQISKETIYWRIVNFLMENLSLDQDTSVAFADEYRATHKNKDVLKTELFNQVINIGYEKPVLSPTHFGSFLLY